MQTTKNDELNIIRQYFAEMNLPAEEVEERIALANKLYAIHTETFVYIETMLKLGDNDREFAFNRLMREYKDALGKENLEDEIEELLVVLIDSEVETSFSKQDFSKARAILIAENDSNAIKNCEKQIEMSKKGYTRKRWDTLKDDRVRHTHVIADGQEVAINEPFEVGTSRMLYPMDSSLGADAKEIINCRCICQYIR